MYQKDLKLHTFKQHLPTLLSTPIPRYSSRRPSVKSRSLLCNFSHSLICIIVLLFLSCFVVLWVFLFICFCFIYTKLNCKGKNKPRVELTSQIITKSWIFTLGISNHHFQVSAMFIHNTSCNLRRRVMSRNAF